LVSGLALEMQQGNIIYGYGVDLEATFNSLKRESALNTVDNLKINSNTYGLLPYLALGYRINERLSLTAESFSTASLTSQKSFDGNDIEIGSADQTDIRFFDGLRLFLRIEL